MASYVSNLLQKSQNERFDIINNSVFKTAVNVGEINDQKKNVLGLKYLFFIV